MNTLLTRDELKHVNGSSELSAHLCRHWRGDDHWNSTNPGCEELASSHPAHRVRTIMLRNVMVERGETLQTPQRTTWQTPVSAGDDRNLYGQGKVMPKDSSGDGANWGTGIPSETTDEAVLQVDSRFDFDGTVAPTDLDRATDVREKGRIGIFGSALTYAGSSGRVTSEPLGRDLNPLGRGSGAALVGGAMNLGSLSPRLPSSTAAGGTGDSVNNCGQCGGGGAGLGGRPTEPQTIPEHEYVEQDEYMNQFADFPLSGNGCNYMKWDQCTIDAAVTYWTAHRKHVESVGAGIQLALIAMMIIGQLIKSRTTHNMEKFKEVIEAIRKGINWQNIEVDLGSIWDVVAAFAVCMANCVQSGNSFEECISRCARVFFKTAVTPGAIIKEFINMLMLVLCFLKCLITELHWWLFRGECDLRNERSEAIGVCCDTNPGCCTPDFKVRRIDCMGKWGLSPFADCWESCIDNEGPGATIWIDPNHPNPPIEPGQPPGPGPWD